jgi:HlyD family secretion protein
MIPDTSAQDRPIAAPRRRFPLRIAAGALGAVALVFLAIWLMAGWRASAVAASASRLRIAPVTQGTLIRDA